jgi:DNA invertase Pin-like site-specific DNA recombinase
MRSSHGTSPVPHFIREGAYGKGPTGTSLDAYLTVSKQEQHEALQIDALKEAGCEKWFLDKMTGSKAERKGLDEALAYLRPRDTLVVWKLDRAGRSLMHLIELLN